MNVLNSGDSQPRCLEESTSSPSNEQWENLFHLCSICFSFRFIVISLLPAPGHKTGLQPWHCKGKANFPPEWTPVQITHSAFCCVILHACVFYNILAVQLLWQNLFSGEKGFCSSMVLCLQRVVPQNLLRSAAWFYIYMWSGFIFNQSRLCSFSTSHFEPDAFLFIKASFCSTI